MAKGSRKVILVCSVCLSRNYTTTRSNDRTTRLELMKYCPRCGRKTLHKESR
jgi:large subunit ribosomal protein L33